LSLTRASTIAGVPVLTVLGEIDLHSAPALLAEVGEHLRGAGPYLVLDLTELGFIDSTGLKVLDDSRQLAAEGGTTVALACDQDRLIRLLQITGLDSHFDIHATPEAAARSGGSGG
jgi:anti-sigma B factor antagonist